MKKIWLITLLLVLICTFAAAESSGTCGDTLTWTLTDDGLLTVSGTGEVSYGDWDRANVRRLILQPGVTGIGKSAFQGCDALTEVSLPSSVTAIQEYAFGLCSALTQVDLPDHITAISNNAFSYSVRFYAAIGSQTAKQLGQIGRPFYLHGLECRLYYDKYYLDTLMFEQAPDGVTSFDIPEGVTALDFNAFSGCPGLKWVRLPDSLSYADPSAFQGAHRDFYVKVSPGSYGEQFARDYGLQYDNGKKQVIGYNIKNVDQKINWIVSNYITSGMSERKKAEVLHNWLICNAHYDSTHSYYGANGVLTLGLGVCQSYATAYCALLSKAGVSNRYLTGQVPSGGHAWVLVRVDGQWYHVDPTWDDSDSSGGKDAPVINWESHQYFLVGDAKMRERHTWDSSISADKNQVGYYDDNGIAYYQDKTGRYELNTKKKTATLLEGSKTAKTVKIPATVTENGVTAKVTAIQAGAFQNSKKLTTLTLGKNIKTIGKNAFAGCAKLKKITIKTTKLTTSTVKANAFKGIHKKASISCPAAKLKAYKKLLRKRGVAKTAVFK